MRQQYVGLPPQALRVDLGATPRGHQLMRLSGVLDSSTVAIFRQAVAELAPATVTVIDMADVPFLDSAGIGALIGGIRRLRQQGGDAAVIQARPTVRRVLRMTGFDRIVPVVDDLSGAEEAMAQPQAALP